MQITNTFKFILIISLLFVVTSISVFSYDIVESTSGTQSFTISGFSGSATLTSDAGPNTAIPMTSTVQETDTYTEYTNQFYRFVYKTAFKPSASYHAYKITIKPTVNSSTFVNIPFYRPCVGTFNQLYKGEGVLAYSFTNSSTLWYVTDSSEENLYFSIFMLCNDINRVDKSDGSVSYLRPQYSFDVSWDVTIVPYSYEDYIQTVITELQNNGQDLDLILSYLDMISDDVSDLGFILTQSENIYNQLRYVYMSNYTQSTTQEAILTLIRDSIIPYLDSISQALSAEPSENADYVQQNTNNEFSSAVGSLSDGQAAINSVPQLNVDTTQGGFKGFKTIFTYLMADIPDLLSALTVVLTLGFTGFILGRVLNKE